jgi:predicted secreted hydrolase
LVIILTLILAGATLFWVVRSRVGQSPGGRAGLSSQAPAEDLSQFARVESPRLFKFPLDQGQHPDYQTEWWYYTGNLTTSSGRHFGYQLTFFRRALVPASALPQRASDWASGQVYMAHFAVSDIGADRFQAFERLSRGAAGLSGAVPGPQDASKPFRVWLDDWQVQEASVASIACPETAEGLCSYTLTAGQGDISLELTLSDTRGPVLQGDQGYSQKGAGQGQASYYYSLTRLQTNGAVTVGGERLDVSGWSWMDHEWSTSALSKEQVGWDWFSIQLNSGIDLMVFQIRRADGSVDPFSSGLLVFPDGHTQRLDRDAFAIQVGRRWKSPHSGAVYPAQWRVSIPAAGIDLQISPHMADQELNVSYAYWEGAVSVQGVVNGSPIVGNGDVELTGYSHSLGGEF